MSTTINVLELSNVKKGKAVAADVTVRLGGSKKAMAIIDFILRLGVRCFLHCHQHGNRRSDSPFLHSILLVLSQLR